MSTQTANYNNNEWKIKLDGIRDGTYNRKSRTRWDFAIENIDNNSMVLDVACGDGVFGQQLIEKKGCSVFGVDCAQIALDASNAKGVNALYCDISDDNFPFESETFNYATALCCIEHLLDPIHCVKEMLRVVKTGGKLIITLPNAVNYRIREDFNKGIVSPELLHAKPGEGMHLQFFNYDSDFETKVLQNVDRAEVIFKKGDLKDKTRYTSDEIEEMYRLIELDPNKYSEYVHWIIKKV